MQKSGRTSTRLPDVLQDSFLLKTQSLFIIWLILAIFTMASTLSERQALSSLNANSALKSRTSGPSQAGKEVVSPTKSRNVAEASLQISHTKTGMLGSDDAEIGVLGAKRKSDLEIPRETHRPKRVKAQNGERLGSEAHWLLDTLGHHTAETDQRPPSKSPARALGYTDDHRSESGSPASSFASQDNALNDSQNTTITIPDEALLPPRASPLSREQLRQVRYLCHCKLWHILTSSRKPRKSNSASLSQATKSAQTKSISPYPDLRFAPRASRSQHPNFHPSPGPMSPHKVRCPDHPRRLRSQILACSDHL